jgi:hypothetical protein
MAKVHHEPPKRRKTMLNIFAESILIATRLGRLSDAPLPRHDLRRTPREFQDIEGLRTGDSLRTKGL